MTLEEAAVALVRIPFVKEYTDRHGERRRYFRKPGFKSVPLPGVPGSPEFMEVYNAAMGTPEVPKPRFAPGTVAALITDYKSGPAFKNLATSSKKAYCLVLDLFSTKHGHRLVRDMPRDKVAAYVNGIGDKRPGMANLTLAVLRRLLAHAVRMGYRAENPVTEIDSYKLGSRHTWTEAELAAYEKRWPLGTRERLAYALLLYTGQRSSDVVRMRRQDIAGGAITLVQKKTGTALSIPIHHDLIATMKAGPHHITYLIGGVSGRPILSESLSRMDKSAAEEAGLPPRCLPHGLRKAQMRRLAEKGASAKQIASISGHRTLREVERYTVAADQVKMSRDAMNKLETDSSV